METSRLIGTIIVFDDAYTGAERYGRIDHVFGEEAVIRIINKEEAGPTPRRVELRPDARIAAITDGSGLIDQPATTLPV
jgi:hypothetical protein